MIRKYVKKPIPIEAIQYDGNNFEELETFSNGAVFIEDGILKCETLEGVMSAFNKVGDYLIKGPFGEFYICEKKVFETTYQEIK